LNSTGVLVGQVSLVLITLIAGIWFATQWTAAELGYQMRLGAPWTQWFGVPIYYPWRLFQWWFVYDAYAPPVFRRAGMIAASSGLVATAVAIVASVWRSRQAKLATTYGSARWATAREVTKAGLSGSAGCFLGKLGKEYLRHDGPEHILTFAPTRSGKGTGLVVPTLLSWPHSAVIHDIKGENWQLTAGWRSKFSHCLYFNPTDPNSARHNAMLEVRRGIHEVRDAQNIADILVDPEGMLERRSHWEKTSHSLLVGGILHVLYAEADKTLAGVANFFSDPSRDFRESLWIMMKTPHLGDAPHPVVAAAAREILNKSENEASGVLSTAMSFLGLYRDPTVAHVTGACDWRIMDLVDAEHPVSLYLVVPPSDISRTKPLIRLMLNQIGRRLTESLTVRDGAENRKRLLLLLDEFPALGRLDFFESALAFMAGYGLRAFLIAQSLNQIEKAYGPNNSILDNCHLRICFSSNDERTAKRVSDALGTATEIRAQRNYAGHRLSPWLGHLMISRQETARPLLTPGEIMQLPSDEEIVMISGHPPVRAQKLRFFDDQNFTERVLPPPVLSSGVYLDRPTPGGVQAPSGAYAIPSACRSNPDDWTSLPLPSRPVQTASDTTGPRFDDTGGGIRLETEWVGARTDLRPQGADSLVPDTSELVAARDNEESDADPTQSQFSRIARVAALDPDDGIPL
jgi:type IV secretion system protein VirD4